MSFFKRRSTIAFVVSWCVMFVFFAYNVASATSTWTDDNVYTGTINWFKNGVTIGQQGTGGVTFFNGTIVNDTTTSGADNPVTFGDNVRVDGAMYRTEVGGSSPLKLSDSVIPTTTNAYSLGNTNKKFQDAYFAGTVNADTVTTDTLSASTLSGDGIVATENLADASVTGDKITDSTITDADVDFSGHGFAKAGAQVAADGTISSAFNNVGGSIGVSHNGGTGIYVVSVPGAVSGQDIVIASSSDITNGGQIIGLVTNTDQINIYATDAAGADSEHGFSFVMF